MLLGAEEDEDEACMLAVDMLLVLKVSVAGIGTKENEMSL